MKRSQVTRSFPGVLTKTLTPATFLLLIAGVSPGIAATITATDVFETIYTGGTNNLGLFDGTGIYLGARDVTPNGSHIVTSTTPPDSTGTATTTYTGTGITIAGSPGVAPTTISTGQTVNWVLAFRGNTAFPNEISTGTFLGSEILPSGFGEGLVPYDPGFANSWTLTLRNGTDSTQVTTPALPAGDTPVALASNINFTSGTNPTVTWTNPAGATGQSVVIIDLNIKNPVTGFPDQVFAQAQPSGTTSFTIPTALDGGLTLDPTHEYAIEIIETARRSPLECTPSTTCTVANVQSNSAAFGEGIKVLPSGAPANVYLPAVDSNGVYHFNMSVVADQLFYIDPTIATGFEYQTGAGDPNFACVTLPTLQASPYDVSFAEGGSTVSDSVSGGVSFCFPTGGVGEFDVTDIDQSLGLDPTDPTAFITGLTFVSAGTFTGTMTAITASVPEPSAILVFASGLLGLRAFRKRSEGNT